MNRSKDIVKELEEISPLLAGLSAANIFTVPAGYFDMVPGTVLASVTNEVAVAGKAPEGYFDSLSNTILSKIEGTAANELQQLSPLLAGIEKVNPFAVPENYFEQTSAEFNSLLKQEKLSDILEKAKTSQPFDLPAGYFEQLSANILQKVKGQSTAKVVAMPKHGNTVWKYAAAAIFTGLMVFGVYKFTGTEADGNGPIVMNETEFNQKLETLEEEDIIKYLEKNGTQEDVAILTSGIDEATLPDQEEYFTDDATLDKFLEDIELKN